MRLLAILLLAVCARAAVVEGVVLDEETGFPLARTQVALYPLPGTQADVTPVNTGARGSFVILSVRPGWYVLRATRRGYVTAEFGQSRAGRPGHAFEVADSHPGSFIELKMTHLAAITGTVLDENGIGIPKWSVHIYTAGKPMRHIGQLETDDRGEYRFGELDAGSYYLRSGPGHFEDETPVLATYTRNSVDLREAQTAGVRAGETQKNVTIRPVKGKFLTLSGLLIPLGGRGAGHATLTYITDTGRRDVISAEETVPFTIGDVQPGPIELLVTGDDGQGNECGSYSPMTVDKDVTTLRLACNPIRKGSVQITGATPSSPAFIRRADLDGVQEARRLGRDDVLTPGHWEIAIPPGNYYVASVRNFGSRVAQSGPWYGFDAGAQTNVVVSLSTRTATISGVVSTRGNPVAGAPIFLTNVGTGQNWTDRADPTGNYSIGGLGPGEYTVYSSFDTDGPRSNSKLPDSVFVSEGGTAMYAVELIVP